jgi:hypothetical protein
VPAWAKMAIGRFASNGASSYARLTAPRTSPGLPAALEKLLAAAGIRSSAAARSLVFSFDHRSTVYLSFTSSLRPTCPSKANCGG